MKDLFSDVLLTVDYDRTLTAPDSTIPQRNLDAIRYFMDHGGAFTVNSGRGVPAAACFRDIVPVNVPLLLYNGSAWYDTKEKKLTHCRPIQLDFGQFVRDIERLFPEVSLDVQGEYCHQTVRKDPRWEAYCDHNSMAWSYCTPETVGPLIKIAVYSRFADATVSAMYEEVPEEMAIMARLTDWLKERYGDSLELFRACPRILDIHAAGCSKLKAARELQAELGRKYLVCVGDGENDLTMLEGADYAYCPADGIVADRFENVCVCAEGAVADVILKKIPGIVNICP